MYELTQKTFKFGGLAVIALAFLTQCSSAPEGSDSAQRTPIDKTTTNTQPDTVTDRSARGWLDIATNATNEPQQMVALIQASLAYQQQQQWQKSAATLAMIDAQKLTPSHHAFYQLARAQWLAQQHQWQAAATRLQPAINQFQQRKDRVHALQQLAHYYGQQGRFWLATETANEAYRYTDQEDRQRQLDTIWQYARYVTEQQLPSNRPRNFDLAGWWRLLQRLHTHSASGVELQQALQRWQASYPDHAANALVSEWRQKQWRPAEQVAVLLPLSGQYAPQGLAIRDGLIAAAGEQAVTLTFYDTAALTFQQQQTKVLSAGVHHVIGPLLKENVSQWLNKPLVGPQQLLLNTAPVAEEAVVNQGLVQFALAPEQEARQAADFIVRQSQRSPLIIAADTSSTQRQIDTFAQRWQTLSPTIPEQGIYQDRDGMQRVVETELGVSASKKRIRDVKIAAGKIIVDEQERSRADIDSVYLPGNLQHVRLLKPFIDVNLSPFAPRLQVYANSAVHTRGNHQGDPDLEGVQFSEAPALIPGSSRNAEVEQWLQERQGAGLNDARLFAMGVDSLALISRFNVLKLAPGISLQGLSGRLSVELNQVNRQLDWARFSRDEVAASVNSRE